MKPPDPFAVRPLTESDVDATVAVVNECELHDSGELMLERADVLSDIHVDGFDLDRDWVGVFDGPRQVGWAMLESGGRVLIEVQPDVRGRGIGTWLRRWSEERSRELGRLTVGQTVDDRRTDVVAMLRRAGYRPGYTSWILRMDHRDRPSPVVAPEGIRLGRFHPDDEDEVLAMFERAFSEFEEREPAPLSTWRAMVTRREGFEPDDLVVATADDRVVGAAFLIDADEIWVDKIAVAREFRHRGIARALLQTAFTRSFDRGYGWTSLSTDSRTGALSLYERIGMTVRRSFTRHVLDL